MHCCSGISTVMLGIQGGEQTQRLGERYKCTGAWNALISWGCRKFWSLWNDAWTHQTDPHHRVKGNVCVCLSDVGPSNSPAGGGNAKPFCVNFGPGFLLYFSSLPCLSWNVYFSWQVEGTLDSFTQIVLCPCVLEETVISILRIQLLGPLGKFRNMCEHHLCTFQRDLKNLLT